MEMDGRARHPARDVRGETLWKLRGSDAVESTRPACTLLLQPQKAERMGLGLTSSFCGWRASASGTSQQANI